MDAVTQMLESLRQLFSQFGDAAVAGADFVAYSLREEMYVLGVPPAAQTVILVAIAFLFMPVALRLFGGIVRLAAIPLMLLIAVRELLPTMLR